MTHHSTAVIDPGAELASDVQIGPFCVIGPNVKIESGCKLGPQTIVMGHTSIGRENLFHGSATIGGNPQDKKYQGEPTRLAIGDRNTIREYCTINTGTVQDGGLTSVGDDNWIMAYVHIAHDCHVGNQTVIANSVQLAGHVTVGDWVILGGLTGVHQFIRIGDHAMTAFQTKLTQDLPPYVMGAGYPASASGINSEGLRRRGFSTEAISQIKKAYKTIYRQGLSLSDAIKTIQAQQAEASDAQVQSALSTFSNFLAESSRGIVR